MAAKPKWHFDKQWFGVKTYQKPRRVWGFICPSKRGSGWDLMENARIVRSGESKNKRRAKSACDAAARKYLEGGE